jgi:hypothetical protein
VTSRIIIMDAPHDTFTHNGKVYDLSKVRLLVRPKKAFLLHTSELIWVLKHDVADEERVRMAKLRYPLLVARYRGKWAVVDGLHRLTRYHRKGITVLPVKQVTDEMLRATEVHMGK